MKRFFFPLALIILIWFSSCQKDPIAYDSSLKLSFSTDTMLFDTVFTTIGSATKYFKVYNRNKSDVIISSAQLAGGTNSPYRINIDGKPTNYAKDIVLRSNDSLFVFVEVTVNPTDQSSPLLIPDSIVFNTNGNVQDVKLVAWGQDVHLFNAQILSGVNTFAADKPYLIYNYLYVEPDAELNIESGARLHFHNRAQLVVSGSLKVNGQPDNPVVFEGDRLEAFYRDKAGQWGGIWLAPGSHSNLIDWAEIKNGIYGVKVDTFVFAGEPTLIIHNSKILNMSYTALWAQGAIIEAGNCLIANVAYYPVALTLGGRYHFFHCTIANYWGQYINRKGPSLIINNYYIDENNNLQPRDLEEAYFTNCIIYGSRNQEIIIDNVYQGQPVNAKMNYFFENTILRVDSEMNLDDETHFINVLTDNPKFIDPYTNDYQLDTLSPAKDYGLLEVAQQFPVDLNNKSRLNDAGPDLGAFERVE